MMCLCIMCWSHGLWPYAYIARMINFRSQAYKFNGSVVLKALLSPSLSVKLFGSKNLYIT